MNYVHVVRALSTTALIALQALSLSSCHGSEAPSYAQAVAAGSEDRPTSTSSTTTEYALPRAARGGAGQPQCWAPSVPSVARPGLCFTCPPGKKVVVDGYTERCELASNGGSTAPGNGSTPPTAGAGGVGTGGSPGACDPGTFPSTLTPGQCATCPPNAVGLEIVNGRELCRLAACLPPSVIQVVDGVGMCMPR